MKTYKDVQTIGRWQWWSRWLSVSVVLILALGVLLAAPMATIVRAAGPVTYVVSSTADTGGSCPTATTCTLRQAINASNSNDPGADSHNTITFAAGVTGTITVGSALTVTRDVAITGPGARVLTVASDIPNVNFRVNSGVTASISGLTNYGPQFGIDNSGTLTVTGSTFNNNYDGILNNQGGMLTVTSSAFTDNGTGIDNGGTLTVTNTTFNNNGNVGIHNNGGTVTVTNSTLSNNNTGIFNEDGTLTLRNSIVAGNGGPYNQNIQGNITDGGHNLTSGDPKLGPFTDNGGPTNTFLPLPGSPAIDAGGTAANGCPATDQRGITRPQGVACDIGAAEVPPGRPLALVVSSTADTDGSCPTATTCTLRQAVNGSNANDPGVGKQNTITFAAGVKGTIMLVNGALTLQRNVAITGPGPGALAVTAPAANVGVTAGVTASISGLTFTESCLGIVNEGGTLTVTNSTFSVNAGDACGGIYNTGGTLMVSNSTFSLNNTDITNKNGTVTVTNSTFTETNKGIYNAATVTVTNSTFARSEYGIFNLGGTVTVTNSTFSGNATGIQNQGTLTLRNSIVAGNSVVDINGTFTDGGHNLIGVDPKLGPLANNGGPTDTLLPLAGSPALDTGGTAANGCPATDQRGITRPQGAECDIGAVEVAAAGSRPPHRVGTDGE